MGTQLAILSSEVKYASLKRGLNFEVQLRSVRGTRGQFVSKRFDASKSDLLAVYLPYTGIVTLFESKALDGRTSLTIDPQGRSSRLETAPHSK